MSPLSDERCMYDSINFCLYKYLYKRFLFFEKLNGNNNCIGTYCI